MKTYKYPRVFVYTLTAIIPHTQKELNESYLCALFCAVLAEKVFIHI